MGKRKTPPPPATIDGDLAGGGAEIDVTIEAETDLRAYAKRLQPLIEAGKEGRTLFEGRWVAASPLEYRILEVIGKRDRIELAELVKAAWKRRFDPTRRSFLDNGIAKLNVKLSAIGITRLYHIRGDCLVRE